MQYKWMLGYEKGPDGRPVINEEEAETVRFIYQRYLAGDTLRAIKSKLEAQGALNAIGKQEWTIKNLLSILTNEKYCGDALLQKTFIQDCISKKVIQNNGQLPKYLVQDLSLIHILIMSIICLVLPVPFLPMITRIM